MGRLFQGVGEGDDEVQRIKGADAFFFISREKVPNAKVKDVSCARVAYAIRQMKKDEHRTITTVGAKNKT